MQREATAPSSNLDALRSIAVIVVIVDHLVPTLSFHGVDVPWAVQAMTRNIGQAGVLAFFVHTSLVLMQSLERLATPTERPTTLAVRFYLRRLFRIYPLAVLCVIAVLVLGLPETTWRNATTLTPKIIVANLLLVQNVVSGVSVLAPLWSLPYEVQMYAVLPGLFLLARRPDAVRWLVTMIGVLVVAGVLIATLRNGHLNMAAYAPCFVCGVLCYALRGRIRPRLPGWAWGVFVVALVALYCLAHLPAWGRTDTAWVPVYWIGWIYCLILALAINAFLDSRNERVNRVSLFVATYSYGLYLLHVPMLYLVFNVWQPGSLALGIAGFIAATLAGSIVAYHLVEAPWVRVGRRLTDPRRPVSAKGSAGAP